MPEPAIEPPSISDLYERCNDSDCSVAYAYRAPFPAVEHYHYVGPRDGRETDEGG